MRSRWSRIWWSSITRANRGVHRIAKPRPTGGALYFGVLCTGLAANSSMISTPNLVGPLPASATSSRNSALRIRGESLMDALTRVKGWIGGLTEIGLMLLAFAIVCSLLVGSNLPFFGGVVANMVSLIKELGANGLVGLVALGLILWLFSKRSMA